MNAKDRGLCWAVVWLINDDPKDKTALAIHPDIKPIQEKTVKLAMREGQELLVENETPATEVLNFVGGANDVSLLIHSGGESRLGGLLPTRFPFCVQSRVLRWRSGNIAVFAHPYFAVTDTHGAFEIKDAPAGKYRLVSWNETYNDGARGRNGQPIVIRAGNTSDLGELQFNPLAE